MTTKRKNTAEFKREAVLQTQHPEVSCAQVARELGINPNVIGRWKRELARVKKERDFLREAAMFFARESS
jgi:transposase